MDTVVAIAIGVLATIFVASLVGLIVVCKQKYCKKPDLITTQHKDTQPDVQLIDEGVSQCQTGVELEDVQITPPNIEQILKDERWVDDASGLVPHCISILKICHHLSERLVAMAMGNTDQIHSPELLIEIVTIAKRINPRVDEVVSSMYPPMDPRLLEARCAALVLSVSHLVLVTKHACKFSGLLDWIDQSLADVDDHLRILHEASVAAESHLQVQTFGGHVSQVQSCNGNVVPVDVCNNPPSESSQV
ncbi:hypothetical protein ScPMuIL_015165 [Solemya velum]